MPAHFVCPACWHTIECETHLIGTPMRCPACHERGVVTADKRPRSPPAPAPAPPAGPPVWAWVVVGSVVAALVAILMVGLWLLLRL